MRRFDQINVIPFIDIMLVLLAIVLTTATFIAQGSIPIDLPKAESGTPLVGREPFEITIDREGHIHHQKHTLSPIQLNGLLSGLHEDTEVLLRVDAKAEFNAFVGVVDALKRHSLERVSILTWKEQ